VAERILEQTRTGEKPIVVCFLGGNTEAIVKAGAVPAPTLQEAAYLALEQVEGHQGPSVDETIEREATDLAVRASRLRTELRSHQRYLRGLFSGGTLASEALLIWADLVGKVASNVPVRPEWELADATKSDGHTAVDLGEDAFTVGRPHPMIDNRLRIRRLMDEASDPEAAVLMLDVVLGYGAHPDPAGELGPAIREARQLATSQGRELLVVASVTGTEGDPQGLKHQMQTLEKAGAIVASCNAAAARLAGLIVAPLSC
jgi:FdrA protein